MSEERRRKLPLAIGATAVLAATSDGATAEAIEDVIAGIRAEGSRAEAWEKAGKLGAPAVKPLAALMKDEDFEIARAAKRGLWKVVRYAGNPEGGSATMPVVAELIPLLGEAQPLPVRREVMWMLSEIGGDESVDAVAPLLLNEDLREDARMVLERLPGRKSLAVLKRALNAVPAEFKINIAQSLRARGVTVPGLPCQKLVPTRKTSVGTEG
jgi:HEAT repeat protein